MSKGKNAVLYILLTVFSLVFIFVGNRITSEGAHMFTAQTSAVTEIDTYIVKVDAVLSTETEDLLLGGTLEMTETRVKFSGSVLFGERRGDNLIVTQSYDTISSRSQIPVKQGDWVIVYLTPATSSDYYMGDFFRLHLIILTAVVFFIFLVIFAKSKGLSTIVALLFSMLAVFLVFIPAILSGRNIYFWALVICLFTITINPYYIGGFNAKSTASALGCAGGVAVAAILTLFLNVFLNITGSVDEDMMMVSFIIADNPIDLRAITFAAILIGALGATVDVSMSISTAINEMCETSEKTSFKSLLTYGMNIGRDIIGAQTSTLVLAYIGGSLSVVLLLVTYQSSLIAMLNLELIIVELLQMLIGGFVVLFTIPATALICAMMLANKNNSSSHRRKKSHGATYRIGH
jgi:Predicted multitransmembrane protein